MSRGDDDIRDIRAEIFRLALNSPDIETMHWYMWLDSCFENDEFDSEELGNMKWRCMVLNWKHEPVNSLLWSIDRAVKDRGYNLSEVKTGLEATK